jgi:uncharacterized protein (DUF924 family)
MLAQLLCFWYEESTPASGHWWKPDPALDSQISDRFGDLHTAAIAGELGPWCQQRCGCLAEVLALDQFTRNIYRGQAMVFAADPLKK